MWRYQEYSKKQKQKKLLTESKPRLIFIDECEKIKLFICLDKVAVKEYRAGVSSLLLVAGQLFV